MAIVLVTAMQQRKGRRHFEKCGRADSGLPVEDCPKHFSICARPIDLLRFAKRILDFYKGYENVALLSVGKTFFKALNILGSDLE